MEGVRMSPTKDGCDHATCRACFARLISSQIQRKEPCVCPLCPPSSPNAIPGWLIRLELGEELASQLPAIEQIHLAQADGGALKLWQCPTPDCTMRFCVATDWNPLHLTMSAASLIAMVAQNRSVFAAAQKSIKDILVSSMKSGAKRMTQQKIPSQEC